MEAIENEDSRLLSKLECFLATDIVLTAPPLADRGVKRFEISGLDCVISEFGRLFVNEKLTALPGSKVGSAVDMILWDYCSQCCKLLLLIQTLFLI